MPHTEQLPADKLLYININNQSHKIKTKLIYDQTHTKITSSHRDGNLITYTVLLNLMPNELLQQSM